MKVDADQFRQFLSSLPKSLSLDRIRSHWTKYAFHFTDIRNAANILAKRAIRCRNSLKDNEFVDGASPRVIAQTDSDVTQYVRLYFRPRTPTQYRSEGIRPTDRLWNGSHCPVPVFFLFDLFELLVRDDCLFSDGNLAKLGFHGLCSTAEELKRFDFKKIYHGTWISSEEREDIVSHRNAELVIPGHLDLSALKLIYCRSAAEKETLLYLLPTEIRKRWANKIAVASTATLFYRKWAFIETAILASDSAILNFSPDPEHPGPFELRLVRKTENRKVLLVKEFMANRSTPINFREQIARYELEVYLNTSLAYAGSYNLAMDDVPF